MATDPYQELLGIPPEEQPADAYRLLGLARYTKDDDMVRAAVAHRISGLKAEERPEFKEAAERLVHEVEAAGELLRDAAHREAYDAKLRDKVVRTNELAVAALAGENGDPKPLSQRSTQVAVAVGVLAGAAIAFFVVSKLLPGGKDGKPSKEEIAASAKVDGKFELLEIPEQRVPADDVLIFSAKVKAKDDVKKEIRFSLSDDRPGGMTIDEKTGVIHWETKHSHARKEFDVQVIARLGDKKAKRTFRVRVSPKNQPPKIGDLENQIVSPGGEFRVLVYAMDPDRDSITYSLQSAPSGMRIDPWSGLCFWRPSMSEAGRQHTVEVVARDSHGADSTSEFDISVIQLAPFRKKVEDRFANDVDAVDSPDDALELAQRILKLATDDDSEEAGRLSSVQRYAMHLLALDLFFQTGDAELAVRVAEQVAKEFGLESVDQRWVALTAIDNADASESKENSRKLAREAGRTMKQLLAADRLDDAIAMTEIAEKAAQRAGESRWEKVAVERREDYERIRPMWKAYCEGRESLKLDPDDRDARRAVGRWHALVKGEWKRGLPSLSRGGYRHVRRLAARDLDNPEDADEQLAIAIAWWDFADNSQGVIRETVRGRAVYWFRMAESELDEDDLAELPGELKAMAAEAAEAEEKERIKAEKAAAEAEAARKKAEKEKDDEEGDEE